MISAIVFTKITKLANLVFQRTPTVYITQYCTQNLSDKNQT